MVRQLHATRRSYPLRAVASLFLSKPEFCTVKLEPEPGTVRTALYQCGMCQTVAMAQEALIGHILKAHLDEYFETEEVIGDPPSGEFVCIARCGISGTLLGPPNHHSYDSKIREVRDSRFPQISLEEYRKKIQTVRDAELIARWKEESRKSVVYRRKGSEGNTLTWSEVEKTLVDTVAAEAVVSKHTVSLPGDVALRVEDPALGTALRAAWERERRSPRSILLALRAAFRHKRLYLFRAGRDFEFVTSTEPHPLDPDFAIEPIREVLTHLHGNPGCSRAGLVEALRPGTAADSGEAAEVLSPFSWLIERGHIIEFFDGTLSVPLGKRAAKGREPMAGRK